MKNILFILHLPPPVHGSSIVGQSIKNSKIVNDAFTCRYINLSISRTVDEIGKNPLGKLGRYISLLGRVLWQVIVFRPKLCYITISVGDSGFYKDVLVTLLAGMFGAKKVYHLHNKGVKHRSKKWYNDWLYKIVFHNAEVILLSNYLYSDIEKYIPESRVHYCANGIAELLDSGQWTVDNCQLSVNSEQLSVGSEHLAVRGKQQAVSSKQLATTDSPFFLNSSLGVRGQLSTVEVLFLSNLIVSKGVFVLLDACKLLKDKSVKFHCTLVGGEGDITATELNRRIEELELTNVVDYAGRQYGADKEAFLNHADIFTLPTFYPNECMPLVLIEAMQHNLPIVSSTEGAIPGMVIDEENGFLVTPKHTVALADKLEILILYPELRKKMGIAGRLKYEQEYTLEKFENRFCEILNTIMK